MEARLELELSAPLRLASFRNFFAGDARRFYCTYIQHDHTTFQEACIKMKTEYGSVAQQNRV